MRDFMEWEPRQTLCSISFGQDKASSSGSSSSSSNTGLLEPEKGTLSAFIEPKAREQFGPYLQNMLTTPYELPKLNAAGIYDTQNNALNRLLQQSVGGASSNLAQRGFLNANASPLAAGMGVQNILPQYLAGVGSNIEQQQLAPEEVRQQRFADVANAFQQLIALLGGQSASTSTGSQSSSGFNLGLG